MKNFYIFWDIVYFLKSIIINFFLFFKIKFFKYKNYITVVFDSRKFLIKKYLYTINHKRLGLYYFYFSLWTGCSGALLATMIRLEMAYPGSPFFKGDSLRYLQVMTAHALIMIFFVVVPIFFGGFANFLLPYHVGSKDVAFPRLNSIGFWIQPCGYLLIAKIGFIRQQYWHYYDKSSYYFSINNLDKFDEDFNLNLLNQSLKKLNLDESNWYIPDTEDKNYDQSYDIFFKKNFLNGFIKYDSFLENFYKKKEKKFLYNLKKIFRSNKRNDLILKYEETLTIFDRVNFPPKKTIMDSGIFEYLDVTYYVPNKKLRYDWKMYSSESENYFYTSNIDFFKKLKTIMNYSKFELNNLFNFYYYFYKSYSHSLKLMNWNVLKNFPENFWYLGSGASKLRRRKRFVSKCSSPSQTVAGWTFITPFSSNTKFTGFGVQDMLITGVYYAGISTTISLTNLLVTRRTLSMPGLRNRRILLPFTSITILLMLRALAIITPVLGSAMLMLLLDRHWKTSFFDFSYGGDPILFHHLFWFFGHPEVYVLVIPAFGVINVILPYNNIRRVASKHHLIWAIYIMNYMGFLVWGHHMYLIGLDHRSRALYSTLTIMISLPATIKVVNWTFSLMNGALKIDAALYASISFIFFFLVAGFTGMWLSHVSLNISMHDTMYVVAHFHLMLSGAVVMAIFAGIYYYFYIFFNIKYSRTWAYLHIIYYTGGQWLTFLPLFWLSFSGLPRRLHDFPAIYTGWQSMATAGHMVTMTGVLFFYIMFYDSHKEKKTSIHLNFMIPRINKRVLYILHKIVYLNLESTKSNNLPKKKTRKFLINNTNHNLEFEIFYKNII